MAQSTQAWMATRNLQRAINLLEEWCNRWKVAINPDKSSGMFFSRRRSQRPAENVTFAGDPIPWVTATKYLGVTLDRGLTWKRHVQKMVNKVKTERASLYPLLNRDSELSLKNKVTLIKTIIRLQLTYASAAWAYAAETRMKRIEAVEAVALRRAIGAPWFVRNRDIYRDLEFTPVSEVIRDRARKIFEKSEEHNNAGAASDRLPARSGGQTQAAEAPASGSGVTYLITLTFKVRQTKKKHQEETMTTRQLPDPRSRDRLVAEPLRTHLSSPAPVRRVNRPDGRV